MRVLVLEDDAALSTQICDALRRDGYAVDHAADGEDGGFLGETEPYDAIVLDLGLPKRDGLAILRDWRGGGILTPVLILTARDSWRDKVDGLDAGADDYLAKPFVMAELLARMRALIRRGAGRADPVLRVGAVEYDTRSKAVFLDGVPVALTAQEGKVLELLMTHAGRPLSRTELSEHVYGYDEDRDSNTIEVFVRRLRGKLGAGFIATERGRGYRVGGGGA